MCFKIIKAAALLCSATLEWLICLPCFWDFDVPGKHSRMIRALARKNQAPSEASHILLSLSSLYRWQNCVTGLFWIANEITFMTTFMQKLIGFKCLTQENWKCSSLSLFFVDVNRKYILSQIWPFVFQWSTSKLMYLRIKICNLN